MISLKKIIPFLLLMLLSACSVGPEKQSTEGIDQNTDNFSDIVLNPKEGKYLIVHADDVGFYSSSTRAVRELMDRGTLTSGSIMMPAFDARNAVAQAVKYGYDSGIHLTMNSEWENYRWGPVSKKKSVWSLTNLKGNLFKTYLSNYFFTRTSHIEREMKAQVQLAIDLGLRPSHIDSHMSTIFLKKRWLKAYLRTAKKFKLPPMLFRNVNLDKGDQAERKKYEKLLLGHVDGMMKWAESLGFVVLDSVTLTYDGENYENRKKEAIRILKGLGKGIHQFVIHPAYPLPDGERFYSGKRVLDAKVFMDPEIRQVIEQEGIQLINWKTIGAHTDWDSIGRSKI